jgi:hypothetical protein
MGAPPRKTGADDDFDSHRPHNLNPRRPLWARMRVVDPSLRQRRRVRQIFFQRYPTQNFPRRCPSSPPPPQKKISNFITALELDTFSTPTFFSVVTTITGPTECQTEVLEDLGGGLTFGYECGTFEYEGEQKLYVQLTCPSGYYATQSACRDFADVDFINKTPTFYGVLNFVVCLITLPGDGTTAEVGTWIGCTNASYPGVSQPTSTKRAGGAKEWTAAAVAARLARP